MLPYRDSRITVAIIVIFFIAIACYGYYEGRGILYGPSIEISGRTMMVSEPYIDIQGSASHIASLSMNGKEISVTEDGTFNEPFVLAPGYNRIVFDAKDKYGQSAQRTVEIVYAATSTAGVTPTPNPYTSTTSEAVVTSPLSTSTASTTTP